MATYLRVRGCLSGIVTVSVKECTVHCTVPEFIDPVFTKTSPKRSLSLNRKRAFWLVFAKTGSIISGTVQLIVSLIKTNAKIELNFFVFLLLR